MTDTTKTETTVVENSAPKTEAKIEKKTAKKKTKKKTGAKRVASKKESTKKTGAKKVMKKKEASPVADFRLARKICNKILTKVKGLTLVENAHGAVQVKRDGSLMFSFRSDGKCIITHPIFTGKGKSKERYYKHIGSQYDHLTNIPFDLVTETMLVARCKDKMTAKEHHDVFYSGKKKAKSGLVIKAEMAKARIAKLQKESTKKSGAKKRTKTSAKKVKNTVARKATKKPSKVSAKAISKVAESVA